MVQLLCAYQVLATFVTCDEHLGLVLQALCARQSAMFPEPPWSTGVKPMLLTDTCFP